MVIFKYIDINRYRIDWNTDQLMGTFSYKILVPQVIGKSVFYRLCQPFWDRLHPLAYVSLSIPQLQSFKEKNVKLIKLYL